MKVVFISKYSPPIYSGAGRVIFRVSKLLYDRGLSAQILAARFNRNQPSFENVAGVPIYYFRNWWPSSVRISSLIFHLKCMIWLLRYRKAYDIIQVAKMPVMAVPIWIAARLARKPIFLRMTLFGMDDLRSISSYRKCNFLLWMAQRVNGIWAISPKLAQISLPYLSNSALIRCIPNPADPSVFYPASSQQTKTNLRTKLGLPVSPPLVIFSGSVIHRKGIDLLVEAWPLVMQRHSQARLCVVGPRTFQNVYTFTNNGFMKQLEERINELRITSNIIFVDEQAHTVPDYLRAGDLFVLPSRNEGLGNAILEALTTGLPVIVCAQEWLPDDLVQHGRTGLVAQPLPESLADSICTILDNPALAAEMGKNAREESLARYHPDRIIEQLLSFYSQPPANDTVLT